MKKSNLLALALTAPLALAACGSPAPVAVDDNLFSGTVHLSRSATQLATPFEDSFAVGKDLSLYNVTPQPAAATPLGLDVRPQAVVVNPTTTARIGQDLRFSMTLPDDVQTEPVTMTQLTCRPSDLTVTPADARAAWMRPLIRVETLSNGDTRFIVLAINGAGTRPVAGGNGDYVNRDGFLWYSDRDQSIVGKSTCNAGREQREFNLGLKRGWNTVMSTEMVSPSTDTSILRYTSSPNQMNRELVYLGRGTLLASP